MKEHFLQCPYCWQTISILIDTSIDKQTYVEDCENCCNPIEFSFSVNNEEVTDFTAQKLF